MAALVPGTGKVASSSGSPVPEAKEEVSSTPSAVSSELPAEVQREMDKAKKDSIMSFSSFWGDRVMRPKYRYFPEFEVRFSANITTLETGDEKDHPMEVSGESHMAESKGSIVVRTLKKNKKAGKLTLTMLSSFKAADLRQIALYFHERAAKADYQSMQRLNLTTIKIGPAMMRIISYELLDDSKYPHLTWLNLTQTGLRDSAAKRKTKKKKIGTAATSDSVTVESSAMHTGPKLATSVWKDTSAGIDDGLDDAIPELVDACSILGYGLSRNRSLLYLHLNKNPGIGHIGLKRILDGLVTHPSLEVLWVNTNRQTVAHANVFGDFLAKDSPLERIYFESCGIADKQLAAIVEGLLKGNTHLRNLSIPKNQVTDEGVKRSVCPLLAGTSPCHITHVDLTSNLLTHKSGALLGAVLNGDNKVIQKLDLSFMQSLKSEGLRDLCAGLMFNESLSRLRIVDCGLTDECTEALSLLIRMHCNLSHLEVASNPLITATGFEKLATGIAHNHHLSFLNVSDCNPRLKGARALATAIEKQILGTMKVEKACRLAVASTVTGILQADEHSEAGHFPTDLANLIIQMAGFQPMKRLAVKGCYPMQDDPGISFFVSMLHNLKREADYNFFIDW